MYWKCPLWKQHFALFLYFVPTQKKNIGRPLMWTSSPMMLTGSLRAAAVTMEAHTVAAPPMSARIASIDGDGLREMPPLQIKRETATTGRTSSERHTVPMRWDVCGVGDHRRMLPITRVWWVNCSVLRVYLSKVMPLPTKRSGACVGSGAPL